MTSTMISTPNSNLCQRQVNELLQEYKKDKTQQQFKNLAEAAKERCEALLRDLKIKGMIQSRSKRYESLETKLNDMAKTSEFAEWVAGSNNRGRKIHDHPDMGDLAGVRVGLFFPDDVLRVAKEISENFAVSHTFGTVTDTSRSAVHARNQDVQRHGDGRWISQDHGADVEHWEHYGYKSWQVVVEWERPLPKHVSIIAEALTSTKVFGPLRVEIQVGTVVTQAWAEVQHNIIYKRSNDIQATPTMKRMIDAINGLAITTDIMLRELQRCQLQAEKEAQEQRERERRLPLNMLLDAGYKGDRGAVKRLLNDGVDVNTKSEAGWTALHYASSRGHDKVVEQLVDKDGVDLNAKIEDGLTALHIASTNGHHKVVEQLVNKNGVDLNAKDKYGQTAIHMASTNGHDKVVEQLVNKNGVDLNARDGDGQTAIHMASTNGHDKVVEQLVNKDGVDLNAKGAGRWTALHYASIYGHDKVVERLVSKDRVDLNAKDEFGQTALHVALKNGHSKVVEQLEAALRRRTPGRSGVTTWSTRWH